MKKILSGLAVLCSVLAFAGLTAAAEPQEVTVSAAISLKDVFDELGKLFEAQHKGVKLALNFGASGDLLAQIKGGAPVDVFASAALKDMDVLDSAGCIVKDSRVNFAANTLVLVKPASAKTQIASFEDLKKPEVKKIAIGNPGTVPAGRYADEAFQSLKLSDAIKEKLIFAENVRQVLDYTARGEVDAGVVYGTDALARTSAVVVVAAAPKRSHRPVLYPIAMVMGSKNEKTARAFIALVRSAEGTKVLEKYGFKAVPESSAKERR